MRATNKKANYHLSEEYVWNNEVIEEKCGNVLYLNKESLPKGKDLLDVCIHL